MPDTILHGLRSGICAGQPTRRSGTTCRVTRRSACIPVVLLLAIVLPHGAARAGSIVFRLLGGQPAAYGQMILFQAGPDDHPTGASRLGCPTYVDNLYDTTCVMPRSELVNWLGDPDGRRLVVASGDGGFGFCLVKFVRWNLCAGKGNSGLSGGYECPFTVPQSLVNTDLEITAEFERKPGGFDDAQCTRQVVGHTTTTVVGATTSTSSTTSTSVFRDNTVERFMDAMLDDLVEGLGPDLTAALGNLVGGQTTRLNYAAAGAPPGKLNATLSVGGAPRAPTAHAGRVVIARARRKIRRPGSVTVSFKLTRAGRRVLKKGDPFVATLDVSFRGRGGNASRSATLSVPQPR